MQEKFYAFAQGRGTKCHRYLNIGCHIPGGFEPGLIAATYRLTITLKGGNKAVGTVKAKNIPQC
jgi:hypothetical protein